jgi:phosphopantothenoylcysteine synthetase/decarboxylase
MSQNLNKKRILVTAGPVWVPLDKVRVITNIFGGSLGLVIAIEAARRGAEVKLLLGPGRVKVPDQLPFGLELVRFKYFDEFSKLVQNSLQKENFDVVIHSAAVADYRPVESEEGKIKSQQEDLVIHLQPTPKIVDQMKQWAHDIFLVKFKLEVGLSNEALIERAHESMLHSQADLMVANNFRDVKVASHQAFIIDQEKNIIPAENKDEIAQKLLDVINQKISL